MPDALAPSTPHPRHFARMIILVLGLAVCFSSNLLANTKDNSTYLIRLEGTINDAYAEALIRKMTTAQAQGADLIILELNTPGGTVKASQKLGDFIFADMEETRVVAYVNTQAYSGGTMVALACDSIYMDSKVGMIGDVAPITGTGEMVGEKFQAPIRKTMTNYAEERGYPLPLVEAMVSTSIEVYRIQLEGEPEDEFQFIRKDALDSWSEAERQKITNKKLIVAGGELLTLSARDAVEYGFAREDVSSRLALYDILEIDPDQVQRLYLSTSEKLVVYLDLFSPLLIMGGLLLLFIEMNNPGFGLPGILGASCIVTFIVVKVSLNYAGMFELILFGAGITLLFIELFIIPGFGFVGASGIFLLFVSILLMLQQFNWPSSPSEYKAFEFNILQVVTIFLGTCIGLLTIAHYMGSIPWLKRLIRTETLSSATVESGSQASRSAASLVGTTGRAITTLRPAGKARIDGEPMEVVAEGAYIPKGESVKVIRVQGQRPIVKLVNTEPDHFSSTESTT